MNISKLTSRRTMRVATVFTGVAAGAAAFTPFAPAAHASSIRANPGCDGTPRWFHIYWFGGNGEYEYGSRGSSCYGFKGIVHDPVVTGSVISGFCGGTNSGSFSISSGAGKVIPGTFHASSNPYWLTNTAKWGYDPHMTRLTIKGWTGNDECPQPNLG
jgi:hypothetical protein